MIASDSRRPQRVESFWFRDMLARSLPIAAENRDVDYEKRGA